MFSLLVAVSNMFHTYKAHVPVVFGVRFFPLLIHLVLVILVIMDPVNVLSLSVTFSTLYYYNLP